VLRVVVLRVVVLRVVVLRVVVLRVVASCCELLRVVVRVKLIGDTSSAAQP
jgi:hypothetical protein